MNKKGFTLIELLATIAIIAILFGIGTVAYTSILQNVSTKSFESYRDSMHAEAVYIVTNYPDRITWNNNTARINLVTLNMEPIKNPKDSNDLCSTSYIDLTRTHVGSVLSISYNVCLICNDYNSCKEYDN